FLAARGVHHRGRRLLAQDELLSLGELGEQRRARDPVDGHVAFHVGDEGHGFRGHGGGCRREDHCQQCAHYRCHWTASASTAAGATRAVRIPHTLTGVWPFTLCVPSGSKWNRSPIRLTTASVMMILRPSSLVSPSTRAATFTASPIAE